METTLAGDVATVVACFFGVLAVLGFAAIAASVPPRYTGTGRKLTIRQWIARF